MRYHFKVSRASSLRVSAVAPAASPAPLLLRPHAGSMRYHQSIARFQRAWLWSCPGADAGPENDLTEDGSPVRSISAVIAHRGLSSVPGPGDPGYVTQPPHYAPTSAPAEQMLCFSRSRRRNQPVLTRGKYRTRFLYIMEATYSETRSNFARFWDQVVDTREPLRIHRRGAEDIVMLPAAELESLQETAHLLRSPKNARRLLAALMSSFEHEGDVVEVNDLRKDLRGDPK